MSSTIPTSPAEALRAEEVRRTRELLRVGWLISVVVVVALALGPGDRRIAIALCATLAAGVAGSAWLYRELGDPARYDLRKLSLLAIAGVACGQLGILYVGAFSAAPLMVALGIYFFCRTEAISVAVAIYALAAGLHAIEAVLIISGVIEDPGFYPVNANASVAAQIAGQLILQLGYALCFWLARVTRRTSLRSIRQLQKATRIAAQRDVQLAELRKDLDRALEIGGPGRFTGQNVGGWELGNLLGRGAMGEVYEATSSAGTVAAVKLLRGEVLGDPLNLERFLREVRIARQIDSPHVVRVLAASTPSDPVPYLAMERLRGVTLGELLRKGGAIDAASLRALVHQVGGVLELARAAGVVHRDLKPHNLFLTDDGTWKVLDFGIALLADSSGTLTRGAVLGTPAYMSPEQAAGKSVDHRADVYALGAVVYRCVTGRQPFSAPDTPALLYQVIHEQPPPPSTLASVGSSTELDSVLAKALAKDPADRYQTAAELVGALDRTL
ncbi:MAG: serine/threonine protein kinase [Myxococcales bacterium]|nr:serine/threonine protein kinase [Myxococcales bacterium]